jgi:hypothetical protein
MTLEIITPTGVRGMVKAESDQDKSYYLKWVERGYQVKEMTIHRKPFVECEACSA